MFVPLKCSVDNVRALKSYLRGINIKINRRIPKTNAFYKNILSECTDDEGVLDGSELSCLNFPFSLPNYDVFISYSHNDRDEAYFLYSWLMHNGVSCFLDETVWNSADGLLKAIDDEYCRFENGRSGYDYEKRNFSTSHVHTMLGMAMLEAINRSECCIFLESDESVPLKDGIANKTLSPWIYQELQYIKMIKPQLPPRMERMQRGLRMFCEGGQMRIFDSHDRLRCSYNIDLNNLKSIGLSELYRFMDKGIGQLDYIYRNHNLIPSLLLD